jgi:hypothetical protein
MSITGTHGSVYSNHSYAFLQLFSFLMVQPKHLCEIRRSESGLRGNSNALGSYALWEHNSSIFRRFKSSMEY